jgi:hypothetical protein
VIKLNELDDARAFLERFGGFFDAVLVEIRLALPRESAHRYAQIRLLATDSQSGGNWRSVSLKIDGLRAYRLTEGPDSYLVLSDGLEIHRIDDGRCLVDLSPNGRATTQVRGRVDSDQFVSGSRCSYEVEDIRE